MSRIIPAFTQFFDDSGDPLVNGFLQFYESGTNNTDKNTYADINELIPNANPVPLDGAGRCPNVFGSGTYNVISFTSAMVQIQQFDPVNLEATEGAFVDWNSQTIYGEGDIVTGSDGNYYRSIVAGNQNQEPSISPGQWEEIILLGEWNSVVTYDLYDVVLLDGVFYTSQTASNTGNNPSTDFTNWGSGVVSVQDFGESLVSLIHPDTSKGLQELQKQNVFPASFNQQWGGMGYGGLPDGSMGEVATGNIKHNSIVGFADSAATTHRFQGFKIGQTTDLASAWVKVYKVGNPTNNLELYIYSDDGAGKPNILITNGTATAQSGKLHTDNTDGEWVKFVFPTNPNCIGGTQYHIVVKSSGAVDASNYWAWMMSTDADSPHGASGYGSATPAWTIQTSQSNAILIEPVTTTLQSGLSGFDGALHCYEGTPLDQSGAFYYSNEDLNHKRGMIHLAGTLFTKDKTIYDSGLGTDSNRIVIRCNATTGYAQVDLYENDETKHTVTGTTDISTGNRIVSVGYRSEGDGADFLKLYVDGASEGTELTSQTITLDPQFLQGHTTIGGGFPLAPTWTDNQDMSVLPSADGWTWTGTATEANAMVVDGGILYQNGAGYASTNTGYYAKTTTLNNATGWVVETKIKVANSTNTKNDQQCRLQVYDGTKQVIIDFKEYYMNVWSGSYFTPVQVNLTKETAITIVGKGSDFYVYADNKLVFDGSGLLIGATATNSITFGDESPNAGENSTTEWHYFKYYEGAHLPQYTSAQLSEIANWNDDKSSLLSTIYNSGTIQSVKTLAGMNENYVKTKKQAISVRGITTSNSTASTSPVPANEMSSFSFGSKLNVSTILTTSNNTSNGYTYASLAIDGAIEEEIAYQAYVGGSVGNVSVDRSSHVFSGLHYINANYRTNTGTLSLTQAKRNMIAEAE